jgi:hypothetical protein
MTNRVSEELVKAKRQDNTLYTSMNNGIVRKQNTMDKYI